MRRAIDTARAKLETLTERDAIFECFFAYARGLFQYAALFVVRRDAAHGLFGSGLGAPGAAVERLVFPLAEAGILKRARDLRKPFPVSLSTTTEADTRLFGSLGRAMAVGVVVPVVVRDRVVAIFLGDAPVDGLQARARDLGRNALDLTKEELLLWSGSVGEALERIIHQKKGSIPPPRMPSHGPPAVLAGALAIPPAPRTPDFSPPIAPVVSRPSGTPVFFQPITAEPTAPVEAYQSAPASRPAAFVALGVALVAIAAIAGVVMWASRDNDPDAVVVPAAKLAADPNHVDPTQLVEAARKTAGAGREMALVRAEVDKVGAVDLTAPPVNREGVQLEFVFLASDDELVVHVDRAGMHAPRRRPHPACAPDGPCLVAVPPPKCTSAEVRAAARTMGATDDDRVLLSYADGRSPEGSGTQGAEWTVSVAGRGKGRVDAGTCKARVGEKLVPAALPLAQIPGAPHDVDPVAVIPIARERSGLEPDATLLEMDVRGLRRAGTVDLASADGRIVYTFGDPPSSNRRRWRVVEVGKYGIPVTSTNDDQLPLPTRLTGAGVEPPACSLGFVYASLGDLPDGTTVRAVYGPDAAAAGRSGLFTIDVEATGAHTSLPDTVCAAWERLPPASPKPIGNKPDAKKP